MVVEIRANSPVGLIPASYRIDVWYMRYFCIATSYIYVDVGSIS